ncbi:MAG: hypothetical protein GX774_09920 [Armatimonadetes bacterium]|nr:hypothetical protein [Armatimonadota bacterium]
MQRALEPVGPKGQPMEIRFLGTSSCIPEPEREAASFVINGKHLVDTGWVQPRRFQKTLSPVSVSAAG